MANVCSLLAYFFFSWAFSSVLFTAASDSTTLCITSSWFSLFLFFGGSNTIGGDEVDEEDWTIVVAEE